MLLEDTIAAIATSLSPAGIGIIRISGKEAFYISEKCFVSHKGVKVLSMKSHTLHYGWIKDGDHVLDEVLLTVMHAPNTFTKENVVEINCHGGVIVLEKVLSLILSLGARLAEPGEFTKRAFLNGRIDLSQAEAIMDVIYAKSDLALEASVNHLRGQLKERLEIIKQGIITLIAHVEAAIDYPEYDIEALDEDQLFKTLNAIKDAIKVLYESYDHGKVLREGIKTVIIGKPNVGKSSLMNALLRENRAIVTHIPGTTRDVLEEYMNLHGVPLKIMDTAGIRETTDVVEAIGIGRAKDLVKEAELILFMADASLDLTEEDDLILKLIKDKPTITLLNKMDLEKKVTVDHLKQKWGLTDVMPISVKQAQGIEALELKIKSMFGLGDINFNDQVYITNVRHKHALKEAIKAIDAVIEGIMQGMPCDCYVIDLKNVYDAIGILTGDTVSEDLLKTLFSQFCLGK